MKKVLAVETSCDDTCVAVVREDGFVEQSYQQNQDEVHQPFGGVVPERASRNHSRYLLPMIDRVLKEQDINEISLFAYTNRPGLMGSLLVGAITMQTLSLLYKKPYIGVNHIEGHILSPFLYSQAHPKNQNWQFPYIVLVVSGGHTHLFIAEDFSRYKLLGQTLDDAAGEAFDKFARMMGLPYPGGKFVDKKAKEGRVSYDFPVALLKKGNLDFSFSGLKTSASLKLNKMNQEHIHKESPHLCASYQEAITNQIIFKLDQCLEKYPLTRVAIVGGVSANSRLRGKSAEWAKKKSVHLAIPALEYCTDNAGMIGFTALKRFLLEEKLSFDKNCYAHHLENDFI